MTLETTIKAAQAYLHPSKVDCMVYHHPCSDGTGAAVAAWVARGNTISYMPLDYLKPFAEEQLRGKNVVLVDVSFKKEQLQRVRGIANKVLILDHHDSAMQNLSGEPGCYFNMDHSGAILGWHYFNGLDTPAPRFLQLIEDRDLWRWQDRESSEAVFYALVDWYAVPDFKEYARYLDSAVLEDLIAHGKSLVAENQLWCATVGAKAELKTFVTPGDEFTRQYKVLALQVESEKLVSELAEYLYTRQDVDFVMLWHPLPDSPNKFKISFRNNKVDINVGQIANSLGGGGHPRAAGAVVNGSPRGFLI